METKDLIAQLDRLGIRGRKSQSALEDEEVARVRAALAAQEKPQVHVGEEKIVADRVVKTEESAAWKWARPSPRPLRRQRKPPNPPRRSRPPLRQTQNPPRPPSNPLLLSKRRLNRCQASRWKYGRSR
jgi:hypothetical protein